MLAALAVVAVGLSLVVQTQVVPLHSNNKDEGVYLFQARMLAEGMITLPAEDHGEFFRPWLSGERDGRIFTEYQVGLPAFLAATGAVGIPWRLALALVAGATVVAVDGLARSLLRDRRAALLAAALAALSPMLVLHSALVLTYGLTLLLLCGAGWALLTAVERSSSPAALGAGLLTGAAVTVRPLDVLLVLVPVGLLAAHRHLRVGRGSPRAAVPLVGAAVVGTMPFVVLLALYNATTTGSPLEFPNMAADPLNRFGFGTRRLVESEPTIPYSGTEALEALWANLAAVPSWTFGGPVLLGLAVVGVLRRGLLAERLALVAITLAFPAAYLFWWATTLSATNAVNGIGPHYYVPSFVTLAILAARGSVAVARRPVVVAVVAVALVVPTAWAIPDKLAVQRADTDQHRRIADLVPGDLDRAVVITDYDGRPYILSEYPFLRPDPTLEADVLHAAERGPLTPALAERYPDRDLFRLRAEMRAGDGIFEPSGTLRALTLESGRTLRVSIAPVGLSDEVLVGAYLVTEDRTSRVELDPTDGDGAVAWTLTADTDTDTDTDAPDSVVLTGDETVLIGIEYTPTPGTTERAEIELGVRRVGGGLETLAPGRGWLHVEFPAGPVRLAHDVDPLIEVTVSGT